MENNTRQRRHSASKADSPRSNENAKDHTKSLDSSEVTAHGERDYFRRHYGHQAGNSSKNTGVNNVVKHGRYVTLVTTACIAFLFLIIGSLGGVVYLASTRLGLGQLFRTHLDTVGTGNQQEYTTMKPLLPDSALEIVAELPVPAGNLAVSPLGRVFFTFHPVSWPPSQSLLR